MDTEGELNQIAVESANEEFVGDKMWPREVEIDEELWADVRIDHPDWDPAHDIYIENTGLSMTEEGLIGRLEEGSTANLILQKIQNNEPITPKESNYLERTQAMFQGAFDAIEKERILSQKYEQSLAREQEIIDQLDQKERDGNISQDEKDRRDRLKGHVQEGQDFLKNQKMMTEFKGIAIRKIYEEKWKPRYSI